MKAIWAVLLVASLHPSLLAPSKEGLSFSVSYDASAFSGKFSGRVVVYVSKGNRQPRFGPNWFSPEPIFSAEFKNITPGQPMLITDNCSYFPSPPSTLAEGEYWVQAVLDRNLGGREIGASPGNLYSEAQRVAIVRGAAQTVKLNCNQVVPSRAFTETARVKEFSIESKLLTSFYGRPTRMYASVALPYEAVSDPQRKFPIVYEIPGFGGNHFQLSGRENVSKTHRGGEAFLHVVLNPDCPTGHSVFADSANNGPWGKALTTELIPALERRFPAIGTAETRYVTGHSSGGWSSLWLQVTYPELFGGCWSTSPDPIDFRDFQRINLYAPGENMFTDAAGNDRPLARSGSRVLIYYKQFSDMEVPIRGEQLGSFEAVFSPKGPDGNPRKLWDRTTGKIDTTVANAWRRYDIGLILRSNWNTLGPKLRGKVRVYMGLADTFYLEGAVKLVQEDMKRLGSDFVIELLPGDHSSVLTRALMTRIDREMADQYRASVSKSRGSQ